MGAWDGLVVVCGTSWWDGTPLLERHMAVQLARYAPVLYVDPPTSLLTRFRSREAARSAHRAGLRSVSPRISVLSTRVPPLMESVLVKPLALATLRHSMRSAVRALGSPRVKAVIVPSFDPVLGVLGEERSVYYAKDDYASGAALVGIDRDRIERWVAELVEKADLVVAVSPQLVETLADRGSDPLLIPNGCDPEFFAATPPPPADEPRTVAYVGHLSDRVDIRLLRALADRGIPLRIVGPHQETVTGGQFEGLSDRPNVVFTGAVPYARLPEELAGVTTCLLPYADTAFNRASFPLKLLEYLAAGRRVVSTDLPAARWLQTDLVDLAATTDEFVAAVEASLRTPLERDEIDRRRAFAAQHSWESRGRTLAQAIGLLTAAEPVRA